MLKAIAAIAIREIRRENDLDLLNVILLDMKFERFKANYANFASNVI